MARRRDKIRQLNTMQAMSHPRVNLIMAATAHAKNVMFNITLFGTRMQTYIDRKHAAARDRHANEFLPVDGILIRLRVREVDIGRTFHRAITWQRCAKVCNLLARVFGFVDESPFSSYHSSNQPHGPRSFLTTHNKRMSDGLKECALEPRKQVFN
jgi:hypothetical protein